MDNKSQVAGILSIISGVFGLLGAGGTLIASRFMESIFEMEPGFPNEFVGLISAIYSTIGVVLLILGILAIVGGAFALTKKYWGLALAASIASIFTFFPCGVAAVVMIALAKPEFRQNLQPPSPPATPQPPV